MMHRGRVTAVDTKGVYVKVAALGRGTFGPLPVVGDQPRLGAGVLVVNTGSESEPDLTVIASGYSPRYEIGFSSGYGLLVRPRAERDRELDLYAEIGATWVRTDFDWSYIEREQGTFDWSRNDEVVDAAAARGLRVLGILAYTPTWAQSVTGEDKSPPADMADYAAFCAAAAARYRGVVAWELWNEPNIQFWQPLPDPVGYTALVQAGYDAIKAVSPDATVIAGALSPAVDEVDGTGIAPATFTAACYAAGIGGYFDAWSVHPYCYPAMPDDETTKAWNTFYRLPLVRDVMVANGDSDKKIWLTEFGAPTGTHVTAVTPKQQAEQIVNGLVRSLMQDWMGPLFIYSGRDAGTDPADREQNFGIVYNDFTRKPSFGALQDALRYGLTIPSAVLPSLLTVSGPQATERLLQVQTDGVDRWKIGANPNVEDPLVPGSGSDFVVARFDDDGVYIDNPLDINRSTGTVSMSDAWLRGGAISGVSAINVWAASKPHITGVRTDGTALLALLEGLAALGIITHDTT